jgi:hypothetical protein
VKNPEGSTGALGWIAAGGIAIAFDLYSDQTMSQYAREKFRDPHTKKLVVGLLALSAFHLTRPDSLEQFDPISQVGEFLWQVKNG